jgi:hypothetical protein
MLLAHGQASSCLAVFFPDDNYGCPAPLLYYPRKAALLAGSHALSLEYGYQVSRTYAGMDEAGYVVAEAVTAIRRALAPSHRRLLFVSKSLGTSVAGQAAEAFSDLTVTQLYRTPIAASLPYLVRGLGITGAADPQISAAALEQLRDRDGLEVLSIPGVGHPLELDDDVAGSFRILQEVCDRTSGLI